jgi:hypothetical protein
MALYIYTGEWGSRWEKEWCGRKGKGKREGIGWVVRRRRKMMGKKGRGINVRMDEARKNTKDI